MEIAALTELKRIDRQPGGTVIERLLGLSVPAYRLASNVLGSSEDAEDVVQQTYLETVAFLRSNPPPDDVRAWFLRAVANTARNFLRGEARRRRRDTAMNGKIVTATTSSDRGGELAAALGQALSELDLEHRLPLVLCYQERLNQHEVAKILEIPERTISRRVREGLNRLRKSLAKAGYEAAPAVVSGALAHTAPPVPATLAEVLEKLVAGQVMVKGTGAAVTSTVAKGGIAMKILVSVVAAGVLAGAAGLSAFGFRPFDRLTALSIVEGLSEPRDTGGGPAAAAVADGKPAPVNEYKGMQEREEVFEFAEKPKVAKTGETWTITFASKGKCDATVAIVDKDGKIVRHLASGVLGANAPWPFQQNSLSQKLEWDGQTDTRKPAPAGCRVKVGLGLQAKFERSIWDPYFTGPKDWPVVLGTGKDGEIYVGGLSDKSCWGRVYGKDGAYLRTFWPPAAKDMEKAEPLIGKGFVSTTWGDKIICTQGNYPWEPGANKHEWLKAKDLAAALAHRENGGVRLMVEALTKICGLDPAKLEHAPRPGVLRPEQSWGWALDDFMGAWPHIDVDPEREEIYVGGGGSTGSPMFRFDGKTGDFDAKWFPQGELKQVEFCIGPESTIYVRTGPYGKLLVRLDHDGKLVPFKENTVVPAWNAAPGSWGWKPKFLPEGASGLDTGVSGFSACHQNGFATSPDGTKIVTCIREVGTEWGKAHGLPPDNRLRQNTHISVYATSGKLLAATAVGEIRWGHGLGMDREGNLFCAYASLMPHGQKRLDGIVEALPGNAISSWGGFGSLIKFRGLGGKYPLGGLVGAPGAGPGGEGAPLKVSLGCYSGPGQQKDAAIAGGLWAYGGLTCQHYGSCNCHHARWRIDRWARAFVPANHFNSIMVLDPNGNRIARFGRYGNVDDNDPKYGGIHLCWPRGVAASDTAFYVADVGNRRILKAALSYAAEETVPAP